MIHYIKSGNGPAIFFIHGWNHSSLIWREIISRLNKKFQLIAIDLPGFGESTPLPKPFITLDYYSIIVQQIIDKFSKRHKPFLIISDSLGGLIILKTLASKGNIADGFVFSGCPIDGIPRLFSFLGYDGMLSFLLRLIQKSPKSISHTIVRLLSLSTFKKMKNIDDSVIKSVLLADPYTSQKLFQELRLPMTIEVSTIEQISVNCVVIRGEFDKIVERKTGLKLAKILNGKFVEIQDVGHTPMIEDPASYIKAFSHFL